jgi:hypothetical protein
MPKIVYNDCLGGFGLSYRGVMRYADIKGIKLFAFTDKRDENGIIQLRDPKIRLISPEEANDAFSVYYYTSEDPSEHNAFDVNAIDRTDPALVQAVEELGDAANGMCAKLQIAELPSRALYRIDRYDGRESVKTNYDYEWNIAP